MEEEKEGDEEADGSDEASQGIIEERIEELESYRDEFLAIPKWQQVVMYVTLSLNAFFILLFIFYCSAKCCCSKSKKNRDKLDMEYYHRRFRE